MNIGIKSYLKDCKPELLLKYWFNCWANKDPQSYQDMEWDWEIELDKFMQDPVAATYQGIKLNPEICFCCGDLKGPEQLNEIKKGGQ